MMMMYISYSLVDDQRHK